MTIIHPRQAYAYLKRFKGMEQVTMMKGLTEEQIQLMKDDLCVEVAGYLVDDFTSTLMLILMTRMRLAFCYPPIY